MKPSRNAPCPCGSTLKHKKCCGRAELFNQAQEAAAKAAAITRLPPKHFRNVALLAAALANAPRIQQAFKST